MLLVEFHGTEAASPNRRGASARSPPDYGGGPFVWATRPEERTRLWQARHDAYWAQMTLRPARGLSPPTPACRSRASPIASRRRCATSRRRPRRADRRPCRRRQFPREPARSTWTNPARSSAAEAFAARLAHRAIAMGGTCTGEHGVGQKKMRLHGGDTARRARPDAPRQGDFDPQNLFNPGKIFYARRRLRTRRRNGEGTKRRGDPARSNPSAQPARLGRRTMRSSHNGKIAVIRPGAP